MIVAWRSEVKRAIGISAAVVLLSIGQASAFENPDLIDYRRHIMLALGEQAALLQMMVRKKAPATDFAIHAQALAVTAAQAKKAFEPKAEGGNAKSEVWQNWADFSRRLDAMTTATADLAKSAKEGGFVAAGAKVQAALNCNGCHEVYLKQKK